MVQLNERQDRVFQNFLVGVQKDINEDVQATSKTKGAAGLIADRVKDVIWQLEALGLNKGFATSMALVAISQPLADLPKAKAGLRDQVNAELKKLQIMPEDAQARAVA